LTALAPPVWISYFHVHGQNTSNIFARNLTHLQLARQLKIRTMLRRPPTAITLTTEDIAIYEDNRTREILLAEEAALEAAQAKAKAQAHQSTPQKNQNVRNPNDELRPLPPDRTRAPQKTREERLGLNAGGSSRG
jgi:hypothetical protein